MTDPLRHRLAAAIDEVAAPVTAAEAMRTTELHVSSTLTRSHRVRWLGAAAAAVVAVAAAAAWNQSWSSSTYSVATSGNVAVTTSPRPAPIEISRCGNVDITGGCPATAQQAEQALGIGLPDPGRIPNEWGLVPSKTAIRLWPASADTPQTVDYNQVWAPAGDDLDTPGALPNCLQLRRRAALPGEASNLPGTRLTLPNGQIATFDGSSLVWSRNGVTTRLGGHGLDMATLEEIAATLP